MLKQSIRNTPELKEPVMTFASRREGLYIKYQTIKITAMTTVKVKFRASGRGGFGSDGEV